MQKKDETSVRTAVLLGGSGTILSLAAILAALTRPVKAAEKPQIVIDEAIKQALAAIILGQQDLLSSLDDVKDKLDTGNKRLQDILVALGAAPSPPQARILEPFLKENQTLNSKEPFTIYEVGVGKGALVWAVFDVTDPNTKISFKFDKLVWEFTLATLYNQGIQQPLFPGVWLSKYDAAAGHYTLVFSAGSLEGFTYQQTLFIYATFLGTGSATLVEARGIKWTYL